MSIFKEDKITINSTRYDIKELSAKGVMEFNKAFKDDATFGSAVACKYGCFANKTADEILEEFPFATVSEIANAVFKLSGLLTEEDSEKKS